MITATYYWESLWVKFTFSFPKRHLLINQTVPYITALACCKLRQKISLSARKRLSDLIQHLIKEWGSFCFEGGHQMMG